LIPPEGIKGANSILGNVVDVVVPQGNIGYPFSMSKYTRAVSSCGNILYLKPFNNHIMGIGSMDVKTSLHRMAAMHLQPSAIYNRRIGTRTDSFRIAGVADEGDASVDVDTFFIGSRGHLDGIARVGFVDRLLDG
jgi:hypothetical protein